jgi:hypothetical protein
MSLRQLLQKCKNDGLLLVADNLLLLQKNELDYD